MAQQIDFSFLGTGWSFPPTFRREFYGVEMLSGVEDVNSSLKIILDTLNGERVMLPNFGCNLQPHVFDSMTVQNIALIQKIVFEALTYHEPRIIVGEILSEADHEEGILRVTIPYTIRTTNSRYNYVYPFYIKEATNIDHI